MQAKLIAHFLWTSTGNRSARRSASWPGRPRWRPAPSWQVGRRTAAGRDISAAAPWPDSRRLPGAPGRPPCGFPGAGIWPRGGLPWAAGCWTLRPAAGLGAAAACAGLCASRRPAVEIERAPHASSDPAAVAAGRVGSAGAAAVSAGAAGGPAGRGGRPAAARARSWRGLALLRVGLPDHRRASRRCSSPGRRERSRCCSAPARRTRSSPGCR